MTDHRCPQGCSSSYRSAPVEPTRPHALTRWRISAQALARAVLNEFGFVLVLIGVGLAVPVGACVGVELALASERGAMTHSLPAPPAVPDNPNEPPPGTPKPEETQELVYIRNVAAIEHQCYVGVRPYPALHASYGAPDVNVYVVYACGRRYVYRRVGGGWWDTTRREDR